MIKTLIGIVRGKTIELDAEPGMVAGQLVEVKIKIVSPSQNWGEGLERCAGALANEWTEQDDHVLNQIYLDRQNNTRRDIIE